MTSQTNGSLVAGRMWTTTQAGCSTYVQQQPWRHGSRQPDGLHYQTARNWDWYL